MALRTEIEGLLDRESDSPEPKGGLTISVRQLLILAPLLAALSTGGGVYAAKATDAVQTQRINKMEESLKEVARESKKTATAVEVNRVTIVTLSEKIDGYHDEARADQAELRRLIIEALKR